MLKTDQAHAQKVSHIATGTERDTPETALPSPGYCRVITLDRKRQEQLAGGGGEEIKFKENLPKLPREGVPHDDNKGFAER